MMKATELRIGNYLNTKDGKLAIVEKITKDDFIAYSGMITKLPLSPIPLTEEWLLKLGFEEFTNKWFNIKYFTDCRDTSEMFLISYNITSGRLSISDPYEDNCLIYASKVLNHVHQLQNLYFALTGEELKTS